MQDLHCPFDAKMFLVKVKGTSAPEILLGVFGQAIHLAWFSVVPAVIHGITAMLLPWAAAVGFGSLNLAALFIGNRNVLEAKQADE